MLRYLNEIKDTDRREPGVLFIPDKCVVPSAFTKNFYNKCDRMCVCVCTCLRVSMCILLAQ